MAAEFENVDIWVGFSRSEQSLQEYLHENYDDENPETPVSCFAADQGQQFCDHDFVSGSFLSMPGDFVTVCERLPFGKSWAMAANAALDRSQMESPNTVLLAFGKIISEPRSISGINQKLSYLGRFDCDPNCDTLSRRPVELPDYVHLQILSDVPLLAAGSSTKTIRIDQKGMILGCGGSSDEHPYFDLEASGLETKIAACQVRIYRDQFHQWILEDLADNDETRINGRPFNLLKIFPGHDQPFSIGPIHFRWISRGPIH